MSGRIDTADHADPSWHIHEAAHDFDLIDAWRLPAEGAYDDFAALPELFLSTDFADNDESKASNFLFAARLKLGELFGWDDHDPLPIPGCEELSLRERLSPELAATADEIDTRAPAPDEESPGFALVYQTDTEAAMELSNSTVHAVVHLAWVPAGDDHYVGQMGIYVKTRGSLGRYYMPAIAPFRHYVVYPGIMRRIESAWKERR